MSRTLLATMPVILVGSLAASSLGLVPTPASAKPTARDKSMAAEPELTAATSRTSTATGTLALASVPTKYTVRAGDTVSEIAGRYGLSTASVLALNGLGWKTLIFPGQTLILSAVPTPTQTPTPTMSTVDSVAPIDSQAPMVTTPATEIVAPPAATTPPATPATPATSGSYTILRGDTITAIAKKFGVTIAAILSANNLTAASIIYAGRTLVIPGLQVAQLAQVGASTVPLSPTMQANALTIINVGRSLGVPDYGIIVALAAAAQESGLQNLTYGDRDSVGLFQQRPSAGWGTVAELTTPSYAAELFYGGPSNPNKGKTRGLLDIPGWQSMTVTQAAQAVQISGSPNAYAKWEASARAWLAQLG